MSVENGKQKKGGGGLEKKFESKLKYFSLVTGAQTGRLRDTACYFNNCVAIHKVFFVSHLMNVVVIT